MALVTDRLTLLVLAALFGLALCETEDPKAGNCFITEISDSIWDTRLVLSISDNDKGIIYRRRTNNIARVRNVDYIGCEIKEPIYFSTSINDDEFILELVNSRWANYELNETASSITLSLGFDCFVGNRTLMITIEIDDTNNHAPVFLPSNNYEFNVQLPMIQGYPISSVYGDIIVRDDDLTTYGVDPLIQPNDDFDLVFIPKDFNRRFFELTLITKRPILTMDDPVTLFITTVDLDLTGYPALTAIGSVTIRPNGTNLTPEFPYFEYPSYIGVYDSDQDFVEIDKNISLSRGYDDLVLFALTGAGSEYFTVKTQGNLAVVEPSGLAVPENIIMNPNSFVITILAYRDGDTVATSALVIKFVQTPNCQFEEFDDSIWTTGLSLNITDIFNSDSIRTETKNIIAVLDQYDEPGTLNMGPYFKAVLYFTRVDFEFADNYFKDKYESNEALESFKSYIVFKCARGQRTLPVIHNVIDRNNHAPVVITDLDYDFYTPVPADFYLSRAYGLIIIRDIDLTTESIEAYVEENEYVRLEFLGMDTMPKNFVYSLITKKAIESLNETISLEFMAFDTDRTGDPRLNVTDTITLSSTKGFYRAEAEDLYL